MINDKPQQRWRVITWSPKRSWPDILPNVLQEYFGTLQALLEHQRARVGRPFLIGPDGRIDPYVDAFFASRVRNYSVYTQRKYAYSLAIWLNFLGQRPSPRYWHEAESDDVEDLKDWRMTDERNPRRVQGNTWHGDLAALDLFYTWAARKYGVTNPVVTRELRYHPHTRSSAGYTQPPSGLTSTDTAIVKAAEASGIRDYDVKWFTPKAQRRWVDLGLRGLGLDGRDAPVWRGRNSERDSAFADMLYGTGLRLQEGGSLLINELPRLEEAPWLSGANRRFYTCHLAAACAKGSYERKYWMPRSVREALDQYVSAEGERSRAVARAQQSHRYDSLPDLIQVEQVRTHTLRLRKRGSAAPYNVPLNALTPRERRKLFMVTSVGLEPLALWLNEDGLPRDPHAWEKTFQIANQRIAQLKIPDFVCRPHKLRHSFALKWYLVGRLLYERRLAYLSDDELRDFRVQWGNTWDLVRTLLGHASFETTMEIYLEPFQTLDVEALFAKAAEIDPSLFEILLRAEGRILTDPLEQL